MSASFERAGVSMPVMHFDHCVRELSALIQFSGGDQASAFEPGNVVVGAT